mgnify:CR=1 FL=1
MSVIKTFIMDTYSDIPLEELYFITHNEKARNIFCFISTFMIHQAELNYSVWKSIKIDN